VKLIDVSPAAPAVVPDTADLDALVNSTPEVEADNPVAVGVTV